MLHLWSLATTGTHVTPDAGIPEWIDKPITEWVIENLAWSDGHSFDGEKWTIGLPQTIHLLTAWYVDELCDHLYFTCIDPRGITLYRQLFDRQVMENIPRTNIAGIPLSHLWYTVDGFYTFTFTYFYGGFPYQHFGSFRFMIATKEIYHE